MPTIKGRLIYVLLQEGQVVGTWTNLKHLCTDMGEKENFISYSKLSKEAADQRKQGDEIPTMEFTTKDGKTYMIQPQKLK